MTIYQNLRETFVMNNFNEKRSLTKKSTYQQLLYVQHTLVRIVSEDQ